MRAFTASVYLLGFASLISARATENLFEFGLNQIEPSDLSNGTQDDDITPKPKQSCSCGVRQNKSGEVQEDKIVGGKEAIVNEFPWRVNLQMKIGGRYALFCGGSVLSAKYILTAAHCTDEQLPSSIYVDFGDHDVSTKSESQSELVQVKRVYQHPEYNADTSLDNDIAILELVSGAAQINTKFVSPVCVPYKFKNKDFQGANVTASGWGKKSETGMSTATKLQKVDLSVISKKECADDYRDYTITDNMICTYTPGKDTCQGDSGGSIDYKDPATGKYHAIGVVSFGEGCARRNKPGVYAKTTSYLDYIDSIVGSGLCRA